MLVKKKRSLFMAILIITLIGLLGLVVATGVASYLSVYNESIDVIRQQNRALTSQIDRWISVKINQVENSASLLRNPLVDMEMVASHFHEQSDIMGGEFIIFAGFPDGSIILGGDWTTPDIMSYDREWYIAAVERPGHIVYSRPFMGAASEELVFAVARTVSNYSDELGVAALSIPLRVLGEYVLEIDAEYSGFSFIIDYEGNILFYPDPEFAPISGTDFQRIYNINNARYAEMIGPLLESGLYSDAGGIYIASHLNGSDWYFITSIPTAYVISSTMPTIWSLVAMAVFVLVMFFLTIKSAREINLAMKKQKEATEMSELLINSSPFVLNIWDSDVNLIKTSNQAIKLFGVADKSEYIERFASLSPELQPCGTPSFEKAANFIKRALATDQPIVFSWMHLHKDGTEIPAEITLTRFVSNARYYVAAFTVDMRSAIMAIEKTREADAKMKLMLDATPLAISVYDENSETVECNDEAMRMFGLSYQLNSSEVVKESMPPVQPDGRNSKEFFDEMLKRALEEGRSKAEFMSMKMDGTLFPTEAVWVRMESEKGTIIIEYLRDLTKEKEAWKREQESNELTRLFMDKTPLAIEMWDDKGELIYGNQKILDISGVETFEEYKKNFNEFAGETQPDGTNSQKMLKAMLEKALKEGYAQFQWIHKTITGEPVPYESYFVRIERQGRTEVIGYSHDVRNVKDALARAFETDERASLMMSASPISCIMMTVPIPEKGTAKFEAIDFNQAALDLFGFTNSTELRSKLYRIFEVPPKGMTIEEYIFNKTRTALETGYDRFEYAHRHLNGSLIPCEITLVRVEYQGQTALICFQNDMRPTLNSISKEREAHELTQMFLDSAPYFVEIWDQNFNLIECNDTAAKMFKLESKDEYIKIFNEFSPEFQPCGTPSKEKLRNLIEECFKTGMVRTEWVHLDADGLLMPFDVTYVRLKRGDEDIVVGYNQDLRQIKDALRREHDAAEESHAKTKFLARMSHEIRTPMNSVIGIAEIELQKHIHDSETEEAFQRIYNSSRLLLSIINDILDLSKVESGKMEIIPDIYETASLIADTIQLNLIYIGSKQVEFSLEIDEQLPLYLVGDEIRLKQILNNLISNAFKYTEKGEVSLLFGVEESSEEGEIILVIEAEDTGQGMTKDQIDNLFNMEYTRFNIEQNRMVQGSGLGMNITYSLVEMMNGTIKVESELGVGSRFIIKIPQKVEGTRILGVEAVTSLKNLEATKAYLSKISSKACTPMPYGRVLVVDDVESNLYVVKGFLMPYKLEVDTVDSGEAAIEKIKAGNIYDIVFMDHMMPGLDGIESTKIIHELGYDEPIVALTANATFGAAQMFMDNGFSGFISKPIDPAVMDECLMKFIHDKQSPEVLEATRLQFSSREFEEAEVISDRLIESFLIDAKNSIKVLEPIIGMKKLDAAAFRIYTIQTHAMKSALNNIGNAELSNVAGVLEDAGRSEDEYIVLSQTAEFLNKVREVVESFAKPEKSGEEYDVVEDDEFVTRKLFAISEACDMYDINSVRSLINELKESDIAVGTKALLNDIENHLLVSDYEEAASLAKKSAEDRTQR